MNAVDYHAHKALSHSMLEDLIEGPDVYYGRHLAEALGDKERVLPAREATDATELGTSLHRLVLEGYDAYEANTAIWRGGPTEKGEHSMRRGTNFHKAWEKKNAGRTQISEPDHHAVQAMASALHANPTARTLLFDRDGEPEHTLTWSADGRDCKCRLDRLLVSHRAIVDLKTTAMLSFDAVVRQAYDFGYHRKAEWYQRGYFANFGEQPREFYFITVRSAKPYRVWVWRVDAIGEQAAAIEIDMAIVDLKRREESGDWEPEESRGVVYAPMPRFKISPKVIAAMEMREHGEGYVAA